MVVPSIEKIHQVMKSSGMVVFTQPYSVTLGGIRSADNVSNKFNDVIFASYFDKDGKLHSVIFIGTVDPGLSSRLNPSNSKGVAIIQHGVQHRGVYEYQDPKTDKSQRGHKGKEAFRQVKPMKLWRDSNKDSKLYFGLYEELSLSYTNGHDKGVVGNDVNGWSEGCWGSVEKNMDKLYEYARIQMAHGLGNTLSFALLHEKSFTQTK